MSTKPEITITIDGQRGGVSSASFVTVMSNMLALLKDTSEDGAIEWHIVAASMNSPLTMTFRARGPEKPGVARKVVKRCIAEFKAFERGIGTKSGFNANNLANARRVVGVLRDNVNSITLDSPKIGTVTSTRNTLKYIGSFHATEREEHEVYTSSRGFLDVINSHGNDRYFLIHDEVSNRATKCYCNLDQIGEAGKLLNRRVVVHGTTQDRGRTIKVEKLREVKEPHVSLTDSNPFDITGGIDSVDFVKRARHG